MRKCKLCTKKEAPGNGTFFRIPSDARRQKEWSMICQMELRHSHCICQDHFLPNDIIKGSKRAMLMPNAVPFVEVTKLEIKPCKPPPLPEKSNTALEPPECNNCQELDSLIKLPCVEHKIPVQFIERETQTYPIIIECAMETEMMKYKHELRLLKSENLRLKDKIATLTCTVNGMRKVFTEGQIRKLALGRIEWRAEDMESAKQLFAAGPKTYNYLYDRGFPLPHETTIHRWNRQKRAKEAKIKEAASVSQISDVEMKDSSITDKPAVIKPSVKGIAKKKLKRAKKLISKVKPGAKRKGGPIKSRAKKQQKLDIDKQLTQAIETILDNKDTDLPLELLSTDLITKPTSDQGNVKIEAQLNESTERPQDKIETQLTKSIERPLDKKDIPTYHGVSNKELFMIQNSHKEDVELVKQLIKNIELKLDNKKAILNHNISTNSVIMKPIAVPGNAILDKKMNENLKQPADNKDAISFHDVSTKDLIVIPNSNKGGVELSKQLIKAIESRLGNKSTISSSSQVVSSKNLIIKPTSYSKSFVNLGKKLADPLISQLDIKNNLLCPDVSSKDVTIPTTSYQQSFAVDKQLNDAIGLELHHNYTVSPHVVSTKDLIVKPTTSKGSMQLGKPLTRIIEPRLDNKCVITSHRILTKGLSVKPTAEKSSDELSKQLAKAIKSRWENRNTITTHDVSNKNPNLKSTSAQVGIGLGKRIPNANATITANDVSTKCLTTKMATDQDVAVDKLLTVAIGTDTISPPNVSPNCLIDFTKSTPDQWGDELEKQLSEGIEPHLDKKNAISFHDVKTNGLLINFVESAAHQWAVELGKQLTDDTEPAVGDKSVSSSQETSTIGFINFLKTSPIKGASSNKGNK